MKCSMCVNQKPLPKEVKAIKFEESGLDHVTLAGVTVYTCPDCGEEYQEIPHPKILMTMISKVLVFKKGSLTGKELVFLRKYLGYSRNQLAQLFRYSYEHLNRVEKENEGYKVGDHLDGALRVLVLKKMNCPEYELLDALENDGLQLIKRIVVNATKSGWKIKEAA